MKILMFNTHNPLKMSGIVTLDLFNQLKKEGHEVKLLVNSYSKDYPAGVISVESFFLAKLKSIRSKFEWRISKFKKVIKIKEKSPWDPDYAFYQLNEQKQIYKTRRLLEIADIKPDITILLWVGNFINARNIYELYEETGAKILWLMYDMAPFTGGCHYAWECKGYQNSCGECPGLYSSDAFDISFSNLLFKKKWLDKSNIRVIAGSEWQYRQVKMSSLFLKKPIFKMLIPVDSSVFKPADKEKVRIKKGIPINKRIIFFGSVSLDSKRKGIQYLIESLNILSKLIKETNNNIGKNILLLIAGINFETIADSLPFDYRYLGFLNNDHEIASVYQAADVFICPSIEDSGPMMINQSIMCGTPVVSFEMGVSLDLVITGETGYRATLKDSNDMAQGLYNILSLNQYDYKELSIKCREHALKLCTPQARMEILNNLINAESK